MYRVLIDVRNVSRSITGVGRYVRHLLTEIQSTEPSGIQFQLLCSPHQEHIAWEGQRRTLKGVGSLAKPLGLAQQLILPYVVRTARCDVFHYTYFDPPRLLPRPFVATCYDIEPLCQPEAFPARIVWYYRIFAGLLRRAERVIVISENTGRDLVNLLGVSPDRVRVISLGVDSSFHPVEDANALLAVQQRYELPERYLLYLGNTMPHKNLTRLVQAMARVREKDRTIRLLIAGRKDKYRAAVERCIVAAGLADVVRFLGEIAEDDLPTVLSGAQVFAFPSLYEGFGLPVLEAMACGTPVITSNRAPLREVVGESAVLVDPEDIGAIADGILYLLANPAAAKRLGVLGRKRAQQFTWRRCAEQHVAIYRDLLT